MPRVSVIIPIYNAEKFLSDTIDSVVAQTYRDWEIIAIDDGSVDKSPEILRRYAKKLGHKIHVITQKNMGVSMARNRGISVARGEYIAFLDHDDLWLPTKLEKQVKLLDSNRDLGMVYCDSYVIDERGKIIKNSVMESIMSRNIPMPRSFRGNIFDELFYVNYISFETVVIRKEVLNNVGLFNPHYKIAEDYDLLLRIARAYRVDFIEERLAKFRAHAGGSSKNVELRIREDFQIMNYWLKQDPQLKTRLKYLLLVKKINLYGSLIKYYFTTRKFSKMLKEIPKFAGDILLHR